MQNVTSPAGTAAAPATTAPQVPAAPRFGFGDKLQDRTTADLRNHLTIPVNRKAQHGVGLQQIDFSPGSIVDAATMTNREVLLTAVTQLASEHVARRAGGNTRQEIATVQEIPAGGPHGVVMGEQSPRVGISGHVVNLIERGVEQLRDVPYTEWSTRDKQKFIGANHVVFHEASHAVDAAATGGDESVSNYLLQKAQQDPAFAQQYRRDGQLEEPVTELSTSAQLADFLRETYGIDDAAEVSRFQAYRGHVSRSTPEAYAVQPRRLQNMLAPLVNADRGIKDVAIALAEEVPLPLRSAWIVDGLAEAGGRKLDDRVRTALIGAVPAAVQGNSDAWDALQHYTGVAFAPQPQS